MPSYAVKVVYLSAGDDWGRVVRGLEGQIMAGSPVLIWDATGMAGFIARSVEGDMLNANWLAQLMIAVSVQLLDNEKRGSASEN